MEFGAQNVEKILKIFDLKNDTSILVVRPNKIESSFSPNRKGFRSATMDFPYLHSRLLSRHSASRGGCWKSPFSVEIRPIAITAGPQIWLPRSKVRREMNLLTQKNILNAYYMAISAIFRSVKIGNFSNIFLVENTHFVGKSWCLHQQMSKFGSMFWCYEGIDIGFPIPKLVFLSIPKLGFAKFWFRTPYIDISSRPIFSHFSFMIYCGAPRRASEISRGVEISTGIDFSENFGIWL